MFPVLIQRFLWSRYKGHSLNWYFLIRDTVHCVAGRRREGETTEGSVQGGFLFARLINSLCLSSHCLQPIMTLTPRSFMESNLKWFLFFLPRKAACLFHLVFNYYYYYSLYYCYFISEKDKLSTFMKAMFLGIGCGKKKSGAENFQCILIRL